MSEQQAFPLAQPKKRGRFLWSVMLVLGGVALGYLGRGHITFFINALVRLRTDLEYAPPGEDRLLGKPLIIPSAPR